MSLLDDVAIILKGNNDESSTNSDSSQLLQTQEKVKHNEKGNYQVFVEGHDAKISPGSIEEQAINKSIVHTYENKDIESEIHHSSDSSLSLVFNNMKRDKGSFHMDNESIDSNSSSDSDKFALEISKKALLKYSAMKQDCEEKYYSSCDDSSCMESSASIESSASHRKLDESMRSSSSDSFKYCSRKKNPNRGKPAMRIAKIMGLNEQKSDSEDETTYTF